MNLKQLRNKKKLTRQDVVLALHDAGLKITENTLQNWENGKGEPDVSDAKILADIYGVTLEELAK